MVESDRANIKNLRNNLRTMVNKPKSAGDDKKEHDKFNQSSTWKSDSDVSECARCQTKFGILKRKHHCRQCGDIFCDDCSNYQIVLRGTLKRSCKQCYDDTLLEGINNSDITGLYEDSNFASPSRDNRRNSSRISVDSISSSGSNQAKLSKKGGPSGSIDPYAAAREMAHGIVTKSSKDKAGKNSSQVSLEEL